MATSGSFVFTDSMDSIISDAYSFMGYAGEGEGPDNSDYNLASRTLNRMSKMWMVKNDRSPGMKLWKRHQGYCFLNSNTGAYNLSNTSTYWTESFISTTSAGGNPANQTTVNLANTAGIANGFNIGLILDNNTLQWTTVANVVNSTAVTVATNLSYSMNDLNIVYAFQTSAQPPQVVDWVNLRDSNGNDVYVEILTYEEYVSLPSKQSAVFQGDPVAVYYESHLVGSSPFGRLSTDVNGAIDLTKYLVVNYVTEIQDWVNPSDQPDFPKEWNMALVTNLAKWLAPHFSVTWTPTMENLAKESLALAKSANPKKLAMHFNRRGWVSGGFRNVPHR